MGKTRTRATLIKADGQTIEVLPEGKTFSLKELQALVGGYIEMISLNNGTVMVLNEEGKLQDLPFNESATAMAHNCGSGIATSDYLVGNVLVCPSKLLN
jgi:hypothetical protein